MPLPYPTSLGIFRRKALIINAANWRRGSESNGIFTDNQPQYPDLQGIFNTDSIGVQALFGTIRPLPALNPSTYPVCTRLLKKSLKVSLKSFLTICDNSMRA